MKTKLKILVTGVGAPGIMGTVYSLKNNYDQREIYLVGTDISEIAVGKYFCDKFYIIPKAADTENYVNSLINICRSEHIDILIPQNTRELLTLAENKKTFTDIGTQILISNFEAIQIANNKFELMNICKSSEIPVSKFEKVSCFKELKKFSEEFGWPDKKIVVKPPDSNGQRGVKIIDEKKDFKKAFFNEKPSNLYSTMDGLYKILGETFPELVVTEYLPGEEYTVDLIRKKDFVYAIPRKRDLIKAGITFNGTVEKNIQIINYSKKLAEIINLDYCFGFQFKLDDESTPKILESNPRVQGTMVLSTIAGANLIYSSVKLLLNEKIPKFDIDWNSKIIRYWGGVGIYNDETFVINT